MWDVEYVGTRRIQYGTEGATFVPVCTQCGRFVKADGTIRFSYDGPPHEPNADCSKCGRTAMVFEGYL